MLHQYWDQAIHQDSQRHAAEVIKARGIEGMKEYWGNTLAQEGGGYKVTVGESVFRLDIHDCPSKGFLIRNGLEQFRDYCDHCICWVGPMLKEAGFVIDHQHNHCGQCWWEMRRGNEKEPASAPGELAKESDVRLRDDWDREGRCLDTFKRANSAKEKKLITDEPSAAEPQPKGRQPRTPSGEA